VTIRQGLVASPATSIVIIPLDGSPVVREFGPSLATAMRKVLGEVAVINDTDARDAVGHDATTLARALWREHLEAANDVVLYLTNPEFDAWTDESVQQADLLVYVARANESRARRTVEGEIEKRQGALAPRSELVLLHEPTTENPRATHEWLDGRDCDRHHHVRIGRTLDYERVARLILGRGVGVAFSGGGARGIAHLGVLRALHDLGIPIDATCGASIGAIVAGAVARGLRPDEVAAQLRAAVVEQSPLDLTLPTVSFASGGRVTRHIASGAQGLDIEDTWLNFRCVSTNLTRGELEVHERGPGWAAVRASFSVPGLFPPMRNEAGDVLVDGGVLDNLPIGPLRGAHAGICVIGSDVGVTHEILSSSAVAPTGVVSGWRHLVRSLRGREFENLTMLPRMLLRLTELGSLGDSDTGDCCIRPAMDTVSLMDFDRFDELVAIGERDAHLTLEEWLREGGLGERGITTT
jgi:predicted acylesterase/phospholipase RssA